jgi:galactokinase
MINFQTCEAMFKELFQKTEYRIFFAPGRINLIGEHTDYNGGHVFPCAITFGTYAIAQKNDDNIVRVYSMNFPEQGVSEFSLKELEYTKKQEWANYPKGVIRYLIEDGYGITAGMNILFYGNIPNGAGLSSSASIELVTGVLVAGLFDLAIDRIELVKIGKRVENNFIGVNSGIMDQFAIGMGKANHGILLDCQTLQYSYAPIILENYNIIIMNTNKRRELADSNYNERRSQCEVALVALQKKLQIQSLGELSEGTFEAYKEMIHSDVLIKRAKHAVYENSRTIKALEALKQGDLLGFGVLMNQSHISLRDDYEVTGKELDTLVETAWEQPGVVGARMTGAGFGGCAIAIVEKQHTDSFITVVGKKYEERIGYGGMFYIANIGDGAREINREVII